ncbi:MULTISPECIES: RNA polymerase sigma-70 factor [unclassified Carboxylicivirga]|uniref:RNA polymerase sigma-70 factor n=1 Tax=Carboxylicivirga TaxID=1628153 RepID=UPI003D33F491
MGNDKSNINVQGQAAREQGFRALFDQYYTPLCVFALKYIDAFDEVEDIVQEVFIQFWDKQRGNYHISNVKGYLFTAVKNNALNHLRRSNKYQLEVLDEQFERIDEEYENPAAMERKKQQLYREVDKLSPQSKTVFERIVFENMKYKEVANELGVSVNTVKTTFSRSLKRLRSSIDLIVYLLMV